jgi:hypothetical protein
MVVVADEKQIWEVTNITSSRHREKYKGNTLTSMVDYRSAE